MRRGIATLASSVFQAQRVAMASPWRRWRSPRFVRDISVNVGHLPTFIPLLR